jgi:hypothetical protein
MAKKKKKKKKKKGEERKRGAVLPGVPLAQDKSWVTSWDTSEETAPWMRPLGPLTVLSPRQIRTFWVCSYAR